MQYLLADLERVEASTANIESTLRFNQTGFTNDGTLDLVHKFADGTVKYWTNSDSIITSANHSHYKLISDSGAVDPAVYVDAVGYVGIGTSTPDRVLTVVRENGCDASVKSTTSGTGDFFVIGYNINTNLATGGGGATISLQNLDPTNNTFSFIKGMDASGNLTTGIALINNSDANNEGTMAFMTRPSGGEITERMRIASSGNVGIGITDPDTKLEILTTGNQLKLSYDGSKATYFNVDTNNTLKIVNEDSTDFVNLILGYTLANIGVVAGGNIRTHDSDGTLTNIVRDSDVGTYFSVTSWDQDEKFTLLATNDGDLSIYPTSDNIFLTHTGFNHGNISGFPGNTTLPQDAYGAIIGNSNGGSEGITIVGTSFDGETAGYGSGVTLNGVMLDGCAGSAAITLRSNSSDGISLSTWGGECVDFYDHDTLLASVHSNGDISTIAHVYELGTFAEIHTHDTSAAQTINDGSTYVKLTGFTDNGASSNCTADVSNDKITFTKAGFYKVNFSISFTSDTNNITWIMSAFLNGVEQNNCHISRKIGTGSDLGAASFCGIIDVPIAGYDLDVRVRHDPTGSATIIPAYMNLNVQYLGNT